MALIDTTVMQQDDRSSRFEAVDWDTVDTSTRLWTPERVTLLAGIALLALLYAYDRYVAHVYLVADWQVQTVDWVVLLGSVMLVAYVGVPIVRYRETTLRVLRSLFTRPVYAVASTLLGLFMALGLLGTALIGSAPLRYDYAWHPPVGMSIPMAGGNCYGEVTQGDGVTRYCEGTLSNYPLGADHRGIAMDWLVVSGARTALYVVIFTAAFVVPLAFAVGVIAGFRGGLIDDLLMSYVDVQLSIPAIIVYFIGYMYWNPSLLLLLVTFGLLSWGGIARLVRSEVLQRREAGFVMVARSLGGSRAYIARRHILPNITNTLIPSVFQLFALLILVEAGVAFLGFQEWQAFSWGTTIAQGVDFEQVVGGGRGSLIEPHDYWWVSTLPALALSVTLVSFKLVGDGLRDALDPRSTN